MSMHAFGIPPRGDSFPLDRGLFRTYDYDLLAGQKVIVVPGQSKMGYNIVVVNGAMLNAGTDYIESQDGKTITLKFDVTAGSSAKVLVFSPYQVQDVATRAEPNEAVDDVRYGSTFLFQVVWWPGSRSAIPAGWAPSDGQLLPRTTYKDAWARIEAGEMPLIDDAVWLVDPYKRACYSRGDGSTTFRVPDYNGKAAGSLGAPFLRGDGANSAGAAGTIQGDAIRNITGAISPNLDGLDGTWYGVDSGSGALQPRQTSTPVVSAPNSSVTAGRKAGIYFDASRVVPTAVENRPLNATGCYIIKLFGAAINVGAMDAGALEANKLSKIEFYGRGGDSGAFSFRNKIINGDMSINERGPSEYTISSSSSNYTLDRWVWVNRTGSTVKVGAYPSTGGTSRKHLGVTVVSPKATIAASDQYRITQAIEAVYLRQFWLGTSAAKSMVLSFDCCNSVAGTYSGSLMSGDFQTSFVFTYTQVTGGAWERKSVVIPPLLSGYAIPADNVAGLWVSFDLGSGSQYETANVNSWLSGTFLCARGALKPISTSGTVVRVSSVQLEEGSVATPFEHRPIGLELSLCQRYYERGQQPRGYVDTLNAGNVYGEIRFAVPKRTNPTVAMPGWQYFSAGMDTPVNPSVTVTNNGRFTYRATALTAFGGWTGVGSWTASAEF